MSVLLLLGAATWCGCARFQYRLVQPATLATNIGSEGVAVACPPFEYGLRRQGGRLVVSITNPTNQSARVLPSRSYVVDPQGESHPLPARLIGPYSHILLALPPAPVRVVGWGYAPYPWVPYGWYGPPYWYGYGWPYPMAYSYSYRLTSAYGFRWKTGQVRLHLAYQMDGRTVEQDLVFDRERVQR